MDIFLQKNGYEIAADEEEVYTMMMALASSKISKIQLSAWLKNTLQNYHITNLPLHITFRIAGTKCSFGEACK
jgi:hypothetical protein